MYHEKCIKLLRKGEMLFYVHSSWDAKYIADSGDALLLSEGTSYDANPLPPITEGLFHQKKAPCKGKKIDWPPCYGHFPGTKLF